MQNHIYFYEIDSPFDSSITCCTDNILKLCEIKREKIHVKVSDVTQLVKKKILTLDFCSNHNIPKLFEIFREIQLRPNGNLSRMFNESCIYLSLYLVFINLDILNALEYLFKNRNYTRLGKIIEEMIGAWKKLSCKVCGKKRNKLNRKYCRDCTILPKLIIYEPIGYFSWLPMDVRKYLHDKIIEDPAYGNRFSHFKELLTKKESKC